MTYRLVLVSIMIVIIGFPLIGGITVAGTDSGPIIVRPPTIEGTGGGFPCEDCI